MTDETIEQEVKPTTQPMSTKAKIFRVGISLFVLFMVSFFIYAKVHKVDYVIIEPGDATSVHSAISIEYENLDGVNGDVKFLTVFVSSQKPSLFEYWNAKYIRDNVDIQRRKLINGDLTDEQSDRLNQAMMKQSQSAAAVVALTKVGCEVNRSGTGAIIYGVNKNTPASKSNLKNGDVIVAIDGQKVNIDEDAVTLIRKKKPGESIKVDYETAKGKAKSTNVVLGKSPENKDFGYLGVYLVTRDLDLDLPIDIKFDAGNVSGPSAGLAFTLAAIDQLSKGDLVNGQIISATGEIDLDGNVLPVGGVEQKAIAAKNADTKLMIVPKGEGETARKTAGKMKVVEVKNIDEALSALRKIGGDQVRHVRSCTK